MVTREERPDLVIQPIVFANSRFIGVEPQSNRGDYGIPLACRVLALSSGCQMVKRSRCQLCERETGMHQSNSA